MKKNAFVRLLLWPFARLYGWAVAARNLLFDLKMLPTVRFPLPVICIGNLSVGGTGKTPFTEYLVRLLKNDYRVAVLSRGYKRQSKGFVLAHLNSAAFEIGDEPCQIKRKFPEVIVAVDADRRHGIKQLLALPANERPQVILLDDAMQHRYVTPSLTVLLSDYEHLYCDDYLLPVGALRESARGAYRADITVVTKCHQAVEPKELQRIEQKIVLKAHQRLYFSDMRYHRPEPLFSSHTGLVTDLCHDAPVLIIVGIAHPQPFVSWVKTHFSMVYVCDFPDHHAFSPSDIRYIDEIYQKMPAATRKIICTEKDAMRLQSLKFLPEHWKADLYYLPISVGFLLGQGEIFDTSILQHVHSIIQFHQNDNETN